MVLAPEFLAYFLISRGSTDRFDAGHRGNSHDILACLDRGGDVCRRSRVRLFTGPCKGAGFSASRHYLSQLPSNFRPMRDLMMGKMLPNKSMLLVLGHFIRI